jgi:hypothetical protein
MYIYICPFYINSTLYIHAMYSPRYKLVYIPSILISTINNIYIYIHFISVTYPSYIQRYTYIYVHYYIYTHYIHYIHICYFCLYVHIYINIYIYIFTYPSNIHHISIIYYIYTQTLHMSVHHSAYIIYTRYPLWWDTQPRQALCFLRGAAMASLEANVVLCSAAVSACGTGQDATSRGKNLGKA